MVAVLVIHIWGQKVDVAIHHCLPTVVLREKMALALVTVTVHVIFSMTVVRTFLILDVLVSYVC